ncbi:MAG: MBOAT family protein [Magnetococcales bacterium]|nr:MBOAT family protein [Magnetococcales bacterium]
MLFNSFGFIFLFLPVTWIGFSLLQSHGKSRYVPIWLSCTSLFFYGYWDYHYVPLLVASVLVNYSFGAGLASLKYKFQTRKLLFVLGLIFNLALLGYFKYTNFFIDNLNAVGDFAFEIELVILPIGLSFFTFQQIAFLTDSYQRKTVELDFFRYATFITFFPQMIAGPIVHHREMMPQLNNWSDSKKMSNLAIGTTIFILGLAKKSLIADSMSEIVSPFYSAVANGYVPTLFEAWGAALAYSFQIYFDFSGYSDMAVGLGWMFGIKLPINFASPYKATNIADFWQRWHITLSRFLRDYLYIPLGGNRVGWLRHRFNLMTVMLLGGMWHGAGWTFLLWGGMHGLYLIIHQWYCRIKKPSHKSSAWRGRTLTFLVVTLAWVPFRADSFDSVWMVYKGMVGLNGFKLSPGFAPLVAQLPDSFVSFGYHGISIKGMGMIDEFSLFILIPMLLLMVFTMPNVYQIMSKTAPAIETKGYPATFITQPSSPMLLWVPSVRSAIIVSILLVSCLVQLNDISEFIYFQF